MLRARTMKDAYGRGCWRINNSSTPNHFYMMGSIEAGRIIKRYYRAKTRTARS